MYYRNLRLGWICFLLTALPVLAWAQDNTQTVPNETAAETPAPEQVDVRPEATDSEIRERLRGILAATGWFAGTEVEVNDGVVFLRGSTETDDFKRWAGELARNTQDVAAVVNQIQVTEPDIWNYEPAFTGMQELWRSIMRAIPFWVFGLFVLVIFWGISLLGAKATRASLKKREMNILLQDIAARGVAVVIFLLGLYVVFHIADLTGVALTVLGGTGLLGIVLGIAFRDITENFLASIFLSIQNPFRAGDLVEISGTTGFIQRLTVRATLLMTLDGNHIQIPNSTVYKSSILNFTSNPNQRTTFTIGIGYDDSITKAQEIGAKILEDHPAVLREPEPWVLLDKLAASTVNVQFYFWVNAHKHNLLKVKSSLLRLIKTAYQEEGISMPDEAREMVFPKGVPVQLTGDSPAPQGREREKDTENQLSEDSKVAAEGEGELESNDEEIREQARQSRSPEEGEDLLKPE
ncbi:Small-conductance mechanosensitive channel [Fodinibius roseus]|uniref:Small-conductance mechanosensitive channel n=1 Tax=Fodinibius roseus TaxID=1194090 RepID=A0A1M4ZZ83_9BACT|nr:mechanosensitive ion channel family protein [Fodinibius roseus]SHF23350.1 Small-conductance mechanosensitive channel [Fodinibius roseus]